MRLVASWFSADSVFWVRSTRAAFAADGTYVVVSVKSSLVCLRHFSRLDDTGTDTVPASKLLRRSFDRCQDAEQTPSGILAYGECQWATFASVDVGRDMTSLLHGPNRRLIPPHANLSTPNRGVPVDYLGADESEIDSVLDCVFAILEEDMFSWDLTSLAIQDRARRIRVSFRHGSPLLHS